ncbi:lytic transglycosylase [Photobacterium proteolyticum]|uniref:Lytic transglycosylase n=1 Tax=Photobacterium proteolyticum TaxID=1903952 RepID=A0A1Q9G777_9GAMM|nr:transglycosylase SLT domain-containing protein [Photobacterium proteolyticum]OLQ70089.1 lytic transglycosylase [Photobacterium proteolyticum]
MKYYIIIFVVIFISGCQGISQVEQSTAALPNPENTNHLFPDLFKNHCEIDNKQVNDILANASWSASVSEEHIVETLAQINPDLWDILGGSFEIPVPDDQRVEYYKNWYLSNPHHIDTVTKRAKPFLFYIYQQVEQRGMPYELVLLPFIESSFDQFAHSHRGAAGLWQITVPTGKTFGLEYLKGYDGRRDVITSTVAALDLLDYLYDKFDGNWLHAMAAYNTGEGRVRRAIKNNTAKGKPTDFWHLKLPKETRLYVPKLLAMADLVKNRSHHDLKLARIEPTEVLAEITVSNRVKLDLIAGQAGLTSQTLYQLNPGYTSGYTSPGRQNKLLIPSSNKNQFYSNRQSFNRSREEFTIYHIQPGDSLSELALLNNTTVARIMNANDMSASMIIAGQQLLIPQP